MSQHPNARWSTFWGGIAAIIVWLIGDFVVELPEPATAGITTVVVALGLFIGRNGLKKALSRVWTG